MSRRRNTEQENKVARERQRTRTREAMRKFREGKILYTPVSELVRRMWNT